MLLSYEQIAEVCHENNRAYCHAFGDYSNPPWRMLTPEQQATTISGVAFHVGNPDASAAASHENWMKDKLERGWKHGIVKDLIKKEHPNLVPYGKLSNQERAKDVVFSNLVTVLKGL